MLQDDKIELKKRLSGSKIVIKHTDTVKDLIASHYTENKFDSDSESPSSPKLAAGMKEQNVRLLFKEMIAKSRVRYEEKEANDRDKRRKEKARREVEEIRRKREENVRPRDEDDHRKSRRRNRSYDRSRERSPRKRDDSVSRRRKSSKSNGRHSVRRRHDSLDRSPAKLSHEKSPIRSNESLINASSKRRFKDESSISSEDDFPKHSPLLSNSEHRTRSKKNSDSEILTRKQKNVDENDDQSDSEERIDRKKVHLKRRSKIKHGDKKLVEENDDTFRHNKRKQSRRSDKIDDTYEVKPARKTSRLSGQENDESESQYRNKSSKRRKSRRETEVDHSPKRYRSKRKKSQSHSPVGRKYRHKVDDASDEFDRSSSPQFTSKKENHRSLRNDSRRSRSHEQSRQSRKSQ